MKKLTILAFIGLFATQSVSASHYAWDSFVFAEAGVRFELPEGWDAEIATEYEYHDGDRLRVRHLTAVSPDESLHFEVYAVADQGVAPRELLDEALKEIHRYRDLVSWRDRVNGISTWKADVHGAVIEGHRAYVRVMAGRHRGDNFLAVLATPEHERHENRRTMERILDSFVPAR